MIHLQVHKIFAASRSVSSPLVEMIKVTIMMLMMLIMIIITMILATTFIKHPQIHKQHPTASTSVSSPLVVMLR